MACRKVRVIIWSPGHRVGRVARDLPTVQARRCQSWRSPDWVSRPGGCTPSVSSGRRSLQPRSMAHGRRTPDACIPAERGPSSLTRSQSRCSRSWGWSDMGRWLMVPTMVALMLGGGAAVRRPAGPGDRRVEQRRPGPDGRGPGHGHGRGRRGRRPWSPSVGGPASGQLSDDIGRCWGQPWVSADGITWEAVEAHASGLDLGRFTAATSGPEVGIEGVAFGPGGFVAFGWVASDPDSLTGTGRWGVTPALWRSDDGRSWERLPTPDSFIAEGPMLSGAWPQTHRRHGGWLPPWWHALCDPGPAWRHLEQPGRADLDLGRPGGCLRHRRLCGHHGDAGRRRVSYAIAVAPESSAGAGSAIAVGEACPGPDEDVGPKGAWAAAFEWTPGRLRRATVALGGRRRRGRWTASRAAEGGSLRREPYWSRTVATTGERDVGRRGTTKVLVSADGRTWDVAAADRSVGTWPWPRSMAASTLSCRNARRPSASAKGWPSGRPTTAPPGIATPHSRRCRPIPRTSSTWTWHPPATASSCRPATSPRRTASWPPWHWSARR